MSTHKRFTLTKYHLALIKQLPIKEPDKLKFVLNGVPITPFGGDSLIEDLRDIIIGIEPSDEEKEKYLSEHGEEILSRTNEGIDDFLMKTYHELPTALEITISTLTFIPGEYKTRHYLVDWKLKKAVNE